MFTQTTATLIDIRGVLEPLMSLVVGALVLVLIVEAIVLVSEILATLPERRRSRASREEPAPPPGP